MGIGRWLLLSYREEPVNRVPIILMLPATCPVNTALYPSSSLTLSASGARLSLCTLGSALQLRFHFLEVQDRQVLPNGKAPWHPSRWSTFPIVHSKDLPRSHVTFTFHCHQCLFPCLGEHKIQQVVHVNGSHLYVVDLEASADHESDLSSNQPRDPSNFEPYANARRLCMKFGLWMSRQLCCKYPTQLSTKSSPLCTHLSETTWCTQNSASLLNSFCYAPWVVSPSMSSSSVLSPLIVHTTQLAAGSSSKATILVPPTLCSVSHQCKPNNCHTLQCTASTDSLTSTSDASGGGAHETLSPSTSRVSSAPAF